MSNIFTITAMIKEKSPCFGFFHSLEDARNAVDENITDMHECLYGYLVIEEKPEGIRSRSIKEYWYEYDGCTCNGKTVDCWGKWVQCEKPKNLNGIVSFSMG